VNAWPDRPQLNDLWGVVADALVVIEWGVPETTEWVEDANPRSVSCPTRRSHLLRTYRRPGRSPLPTASTMSSSTSSISKGGGCTMRIPSSGDFESCSSGRR